MIHYAKILNAVKYAGGIILAIGIVSFSCGFFVNGFGLLTPIGIGAMMGAVFIFLMGVFFAATHEALDKIKS